MVAGLKTGVLLGPLLVAPVAGQDVGQVQDTLNQILNAFSGAWAAAASGGNGQNSPTYALGFDRQSIFNYLRCDLGTIYKNVKTDGELLDTLDNAATGLFKRTVRVYGSGWSWNDGICPQGGGVQVKLVGDHFGRIGEVMKCQPGWTAESQDIYANPLCNPLQEGGSCGSGVVGDADQLFEGAAEDGACFIRAGAGALITKVNQKLVKQGLQINAKGGCAGQEDSQTVGGMLATNVGDDRSETLGVLHDFKLAQYKLVQKRRLFWEWTEPEGYLKQCTRRDFVTGSDLPFGDEAGEKTCNYALGTVGRLGIVTEATFLVKDLVYRSYVQTAGDAGASLSALYQNLWTQYYDPTDSDRKDAGDKYDAFFFRSFSSNPLTLIRRQGGDWDAASEVVPANLTDTTDAGLIFSPNPLQPQILTDETWLPTYPGISIGTAADGLVDFVRLLVPDSGLLLGEVFSLLFGLAISDESYRGHYYRTQLNLQFFSHWEGEIFVPISQADQAAQIVEDTLKNGATEYRELVVAARPPSQSQAGLFTVTSGTEPRIGFVIDKFLTNGCAGNLYRAFAEIVQKMRDQGIQLRMHPGKIMPADAEIDAGFSDEQMNAFYNVVDEVDPEGVFRVAHFKRDREYLGVRQWKDSDYC